MFSMHEDRVKGVCDYLAKQGKFRVVMPDLHLGKPLTDHYYTANLDGWVKEHPIEEVVQLFQATVDKVKTDGADCVAVLGFSWGAWVIFRALKEGLEVEGVACMHPSLDLEEMSDGSISQLVEDLKTPLFIASAGNDPDSVKPGGLVSQVVKNKKLDADSMIIEYPEMKHGWTIRGDVAD